MITQEQIEQAAVEYADKKWRSPHYSSAVLNASEDSFEAGAKWALNSLWIPVTERLPEDRRVIVSYSHGVGECSYENGAFFIRMNDGSNWINTDVPGVTHWMPLPLKSTQP